MDVGAGDRASVADDGRHHELFRLHQGHGRVEGHGGNAESREADGLRQYAGPGHWNDPDMLEVGNGLTPNEDRAHFSMWAMVAAPLIAGNDLRTMAPETRTTLTNRDVIAVNQDSLGVQGFRYAVRDSVEFWFKPMTHDAWAMTVLNRSSRPRRVEFDWAREAVVDSIARRETAFGATRYELRNLWTGKGNGTTVRPLSETVPSRDVLMVRLSRM